MFNFNTIIINLIGYDKKEMFLDSLSYLEFCLHLRYFKL